MLPRGFECEKMIEGRYAVDSTQRDSECRGPRTFKCSMSKYPKDSWTVCNVSIRACGSLPCSPHGPVNQSQATIFLFSWWNICFCHRAFSHFVLPHRCLDPSPIVGAFVLSVKRKPNGFTDLTVPADGDFLTKMRASGVPKRGDRTVL